MTFTGIISYEGRRLVRAFIYIKLSERFPLFYYYELHKKVSWPYLASFYA